MNTPTPLKKTLSTKQVLTLVAISTVVLLSCALWLGWQKMVRGQDALEVQIAALQQHITELQNQPSPSIPTVIEQKIAVLANDIATLKDRPITQDTTLSIQQTSTVHPLLATLSLQLLRQQMMTGEPFPLAYKQTKAALLSVGITTETPQLASAANTGIPSTATLLETFDSIVKKPVTLTQDPTSWLGKTLSSLVQVKKVYAADNNAIAQTQQALRNEQIQRALSEVERLPQELKRQRELQEWQENIKKRQEVIKELDALEKQAEELTKQQHPPSIIPTAPPHD